MLYKASLIISTFQRPHLLKWGLLSIARQQFPFEFETIVINDGLRDETEEICQQYQDSLNLEYIFTGSRNKTDELKWRVPGFAINIGAKQSSGQVLIISCAEMFHLNNTLEQLTIPVLKNDKLLAIPMGWDDQGAFLQQLNKNNGHYEETLLQKCGALNIKLPFLLAVSRHEFFKIGGYDEDFTGMAFDDNDLVDRLITDGCTYLQTGAKTIHLYHRHVQASDDMGRCSYNGALYRQRRGKVIRNEGKEWGKL